MLGNRNAASEYIQRGTFSTAIQNGSGPLYISNAVTITFPSAFNAAPKMYGNQNTVGSYWGFVIFTSITTTGCTAYVVADRSTAGTDTFAWHAIGS